MHDTESSPIIRLFGPMCVLVRGAPLPRFRRRSAEWLLALLALRNGREVERSWLAGTLWPESSDSRARQNLRNDLVELRKALGSEATRIRSPRPSTLALDLRGVDFDFGSFLAGLEAGDEEGLRRAVEAYDGQLLEGCYEEWVVPEREAASARCLAALEALANLCEGRKDYAGAIRWLRRAEQIDPLRDSTVRRLMSALAESGDNGCALDVFRSFRDRLHRELSVSPDEDTTRLFRQIRARAQEAAAQPASREAIYGESAAGGQMARANRVVSVHPPHPLTQLVGRDEEAAAVLNRLSRSRLVTLVGSGGVGKTRLAMEVAAQLDDELPGGAGWVQLASLTDAGLVEPAIAHAFGIRDEGNMRSDDLLARVAQRVGASRCLLVLDNCEHLLDPVAKAVDVLLQACRNLTILATSREPLRLTGEVVWRVPSLPTPESGELPDDGPAAVDHALSFPAVRLFCDRAEESRPGFRMGAPGDVRAVCSICRHLDGIPLAIELAAARMRSMSLEELLAGLDDRFRLLTGGSRAALPRHQTLRATIDFSYALLDQAEQAMLRRVSVFRGGWSLEAAEAVCSGQGIDAADARRLLDALVEKSLLNAARQRDSLRYEMLETVRQYSLHRMQENGEEQAWRNRHLSCFVDLAELAQPHLSGTKVASWLERLELENDNLRAALEWAISGPERTERGMRLCVALLRFWQRRGYCSYGDAQLARLLEGDGTVNPTIRAQALNTAGVLARMVGRFPESVSRHEASVEIWESMGDRRNCASSLRNLGLTEISRGDFGRARSCLQDSLAICREFGDRHGEADNLESLGHIDYSAGDAASAQSFYEQSLIVSKDVGDPHGVAVTTMNLGNVAVMQGDWDAAQSRYQTALSVFREVGDEGHAALALGNLAGLAMDRGDLDTARSLGIESLRALFLMNDRENIAESLETLGITELKRGAPLTAARIWGAAERLREEIGARLGPADQSRMEAEAAAARAAAEDACAFDAAWQHGRAMTLEQAIETVLKV